MEYTGARYQPSGMMNPLTVAFFILLALVAAAAGYVYEYVVIYIPLIYLNLLAVMGLGFGVGYAGAFAVKKGHCRNRAVAALLAGLVAAAALGASYLALAHYMAGEAIKAGVDKDIVDQASFWKLLDLRMQSGWSISSHGSSGSDFNGTWAVGGVWLVEALTVLGIAVVVSAGAAGEPYCEKCSEWAKGRVLTLRGLTRADAEAALDKGLGAVIALEPPADFDPSMGVSLAVEPCPRCKDTGFVTVSTFQLVKKGKKTETVKKHLVKHAVLRTDELAQITARLDGLEAPAALQSAAGG